MLREIGLEHHLKNKNQKQQQKRSEPAEMGSKIVDGPGVHLIRQPVVFVGQVNEASGQDSNQGRYCKGHGQNQGQDDPISKEQCEVDDQPSATPPAPKCEAIRAGNLL